METYVYLDGGSATSMMDSAIVDRLGLQGKPELIRLKWTQGIVREQHALKTSISISNTNKQEKFNLDDIFAVDNLDLPSQSLDAAALKSAYPHLREAPIKDMINVKPMLLIGLSHTSYLAGLKCYIGGDQDPVAQETKLGWVVYGNSAPKIVDRRSIESHSSDIAQDFKRPIIDVENFANANRPTTLAVSSETSGACKSALIRTANVIEQEMKARAHTRVQRHKADRPELNANGTRKAKPKKQPVSGKAQQGYAAFQRIACRRKAVPASQENKKSRMCRRKFQMIDWKESGARLPQVDI